MSTPYVEFFEAFARNGGGSGPAWVPAFRRAAFDRFSQVGFPSSRDEEWRFTPIAPIAKEVWGPAKPSPSLPTLAELDRFAFGHEEWSRVVLVNGKYAPTLSRGVGASGRAKIMSLAAAIEQEPELVNRHLGRLARTDASGFAALNGAFLRDGAVIIVPPSVELADPIQLLSVTTSEAGNAGLHPRYLLIVGERSRAQFVESYVTLAPGARYLTNAVVEVVVGANAWVEHTRIQQESEAAFHVGLTEVEQQRDSHYRSFCFAMGGAISRHNLHARLDAPNTEALLYGLYFGQGEQLVDNHTAIYHNQPNCRSWEVYKGILDDRSHGVFNGKIFVKPEAQKTDAKQTNRALLMSETAKIDTKPQLEIFADDVKCTHGAAVGQIDEVACFYLQSRGIPQAEARRLLTYAFAAEVLEEISSQPVRTALNRVVMDRLRHGT